MIDKEQARESINKIVADKIHRKHSKYEASLEQKRNLLEIVYDKLIEKGDGSEYQTVSMICGPDINYMLDTAKQSDEVNA